MGKEIIFHIMYYLNFLCIIYSSFKLLSYLYYYSYFYKLYISYVINIFHTLCIICINYMVLFPAKIFPVLCLPLILYNYYFSLQFPPGYFFCLYYLSCTFFWYFTLINSTLPFPYNYFVLYLFYTQELLSNIKLCIYQLSFSQTYKMAIKNSQK